MPNEAFIFDAVRTPRGKGKASGALNEVKPVALLRTLLKSIQQRNALDTAQVDDVVLGCVTPVGDQGGNIARTAVLDADWDVDVTGLQINRFCSSGLEAVNLAAMYVHFQRVSAHIVGLTEREVEWLEHGREGLHAAAVAPPSPSWCPAPAALAGISARPRG